MLFRKQVTKSILLPGSDQILVMLEQPDYEYISEGKQCFNMLALVSRSTMKASALLNLQRAEVANCA
jgi:hypothetical protein